MRGNAQRIVLPESMDEIAAAIGSSACLSLIQRFAGSRLYVPKADAMTEIHPIAELLGLPLALKLSAAIGGEPITIPRCQRLALDQRDAEIVRRNRKGQSAAVLARSFGLTDRMVRSILARSRVEA